MSLSVFGRTDSILSDAAMVPGFDEAICHVPTSAVMVVPTTSHIRGATRLWAERRAGEPLPQIVTMSGFIHNLFTQVRSREVHSISDVECELLLDIALKNVGEQFMPDGLSVHNIVRWKQELHSAHSVGEMYTDENRPHRLDAMYRVVKIWDEYERCKGQEYLDRGDVVQYVIDTAATRPEAFRQQPALVLYTHGLSVADRSLLTLLALAGWDIAVRFSLSGTATDRSRSMATWMVAHGWHVAESEELKQHATTILRKWPTKREEIVRALGVAKELVSNGVHYHDIAIITPRSGLYDNLITELAASAQIPLSISRRTPLEHSGSATAILAACHVTGRKWRRTDVDRLIRSGYVNVPSMPISRIYECGAIARVTGGNGWREWIDRFQGARDALSSVKDFDDDAQVTSLVTIFEEGISCVQWLAKTIDISDELITPEVFVGWIRENLIQGLGIDLPIPLMNSLEIYKRAAERHIRGETLLADHITRWWSIVRTLDIVESKLQFRGITIAKPQELRGLRFKYVLALGFIEGELPSASWDPISEELLAGIREAMDHEALADIRNSVTDEGLLVISVPAADDGDETVDSRFLDDVAAGSAKIAYGQASGIRCLDSTTRLVISPAEILAYSGRSMDDVNERQKGVIPSALDKDILSSFRKILNEPISPSRIDTVAQCPFRFYVKYVLRVETQQTADEVISPVERGSLMHAVAAKFFNQVRGHVVPDISSVGDVRAAMADLTTRTTEEWLPLLQLIYEEERKKIPGGYLYDVVERSMMYDADFRAGMLHRWLETEMQIQRTTDFKPILLELRIDDAITLGSDENVPIRLRIDRVDAAIRGDEVHCVVIDYKTTSTSIPTFNDVEAGRKSQMPLYAQAIRRFFAMRNIKCVIAQGSYHTFGKSVNDSNNPKVSTRLDGGIDLETALHNVDKYFEVIKSGYLPVNPSVGACRSCDVRDVCRVNHWGTYITNYQTGVRQRTQGNR